MDEKDLFQISQDENMVTVNPALDSKSGGLTFSVIAVVQLAISVLVAIGLSAVAGALVGKGEYEDLGAALVGIQNGKGYLYLSFLIAPVVFAVSSFAVLKFRKIRFKEIFPVKCSPKYYLIGIMIVAGLYLSLNQINSLFMQLIGKEEGNTYKVLDEYLSTLSGWDIPLAFLIFAVLPAFFEELVFRGIMLNTTEKSMGTVRAVFVSGFCFAIFHGALEQSIYQFLAGCLFAFVALRSGSILPGILMHFINNGIVVVLGACGLYNSLETIPTGVNIAMIAVGACCLIGGVIWLIFDKKPLIRCRAGGVKSFFLYASVGIAIMALTIITSLF